MLFQSLRTTTTELPKITNLKYTIEKSLLYETFTFEFKQHILWEKLTTIILITTYTFSVLFIFCNLLERIHTTMSTL